MQVLLYFVTEPAENARLREAAKGWGWTYEGWGWSDEPPAGSRTSGQRYINIYEWMNERINERKN